MDFARFAVAIMAAGQSSRFGGNKLETLLDGKMLGLAIAETLVPLGFGARFAVTSAQNEKLALNLAGLEFQIIGNPDPGAGLSGSIKLAAMAALNTDTDALMICLADMPFVNSACINAMIASYDGEPLIVTDGHVTSPPAILPRRLWASLSKLEGDAGARALLANARRVMVQKGVLRDIDVREDFDVQD